MKLQVLGCAGGIGGREQLTTCFLLDQDILIDAGSGITTLTEAQLCAINHVFITHSHLDHVLGLALLADSILYKRNKPVIVHASVEVIATLKTHLFNWKLWPDFSVLPDPDHGVLQWEVMPAQSSVQINERIIFSFPVHHTVDAVAYWVHNQNDGFLFTGDLSSTPELWARFSKEKKLGQIFIDCSFPDHEAKLALDSRHYCPMTLLQDVKPMPPSIKFAVTHLKPGQEDLIMAQLQSQSKGGHQFTALRRGAQFEF